MGMSLALAVMLCGCAFLEVQTPRVVYVDEFDLSSSICGFSRKTQTRRTVGGHAFSVCGASFELSPMSFYQVNPAQAERLYAKALEFAAPAGCGCVLDLYCGAGTISLCLARGAQHVIGAEIVPAAVENARENAARNSLHNVEFLCADAGQAAAELARRGVRPEAVVVDPPRKGLSEEVIGAICAIAPERIVYVSCDVATQARDLQRFDRLGYAAAQAVAVDMFPRTAHVETVCCLYHQKKEFISVPYEPKNADYLKKNSLE